MAIETKEQVFEKVISMKKPFCPHCKKEMSIYEVPPVTFSDGLGWGTPYLFLCFNDDCSLYKQGWENLKENYNQTASYRCMNYPGTDTFELMPVFSPMGATGQIIDDQVVAAEEALKEATKKGFLILADCYTSKDSPAVLRLLVDPTEPAKVRLKAAEMLGDIGELEAVDALRNLKTGNELIQKEIDKSVKKIHEKHFTRDCPFCAEIIKKKAKICKHCQREVAGE
ncbi:MAG: HEAT repeat domain-containing protein [Deltaproteobacteria bacterium]|nr:HEAT repeat domain-containing protein [Deltaproteobacteria bacterium]